MKNSYESPAIEMIAIESKEILCASTESYGNSDRNYGETDWT